MKLTVWGARGSVPVCGPQYLRHGGDTTCVELETADGQVVILDAGTGLRALGNALLERGVKTMHLVLTHAHWDHLLGFLFFKPLYQPDVTIHIHGCSSAQQSLRGVLTEAMRPPFFPVRLDDVAASLLFDERRCADEFEVGGVLCRSLPLSHPDGGHGFRLEEGGRSLAFLPDNELEGGHRGGKAFTDYARFVAGAEVLIHDAEWLPAEYERFARGWGHSVFLDTVRLGVAAGVDRLVLWHLNQDRDDDQADALLQAAEQAAAGALPGMMMGRAGLTLEV